MNENKIPHMETIKATAELLNLPVFFVRQKVLSGEIVAVKAGKKYLVNVDYLIEYLNTSFIREGAEQDSAAAPMDRQ